jgi:Condensation domain
LQLIHAPRPVAIAEVDLSASGADDATFRQHLRAELQTRIDAETWPVRVTLWRLGDADHVICCNMHHLVTDGHSCGIFVRELRLFYDRALGRPCAIPPVGWQHARFAAWEAESLKDQAYAKHLDYWRGQLANARMPALPFADQPSDQAAWRGETRVLDFDSATVDRLRSVARSSRTTPFATMLAVYYSVLYQLTKETDLSIGSVFLNRPLPEVQNTIGFFTNLLVLRTRVPSHASFMDLVRDSLRTVPASFLGCRKSFCIRGVKGYSLRSTKPPQEEHPVPQR